MVIQDLTETLRNEQQLVFIAQRDVLTGLSNRREFERRLDDAERLRGRVAERIRALGFFTDAEVTAREPNICCGLLQEERLGIMFG